LRKSEATNFRKGFLQGLLLGIWMILLTLDFEECRKKELALRDRPSDIT